jgi:hypothetical protein
MPINGFPRKQLHWIKRSWTTRKARRSPWALARKALAPVNGMDVRYDGGGGVYANLFDAGRRFRLTPTSA